MPEPWDHCYEQDLWVAVLVQAIYDGLGRVTATSGGNLAYAKTKKTMAQNSTKYWFSLRNKDFIEVCNLAGVDPEYVCDGFHSGKFNAAVLDCSRLSGKIRVQRHARNPN